MKALVISAAWLVLAGCVLPQTTVHTGSKPAALSVQGAPADATLFVDGLSMGTARTYDGNPNVLSVLEGVHLVEVRQGSGVLYSEKIMVSSGETRPVVLPPKAVP